MARFRKIRSLFVAVPLCLLLILLLVRYNSLFQSRAELTAEEQLFAPKSIPQLREGVVAQPCVGFQSQSGKWGYETGLCPAHHAFMANTTVEGGYVDGPGEFVMLDGLCCPLPAEDILTDRHSYSEVETCPDQTVATGGAGVCSYGCTMRCTQINTEKYRLGPEREGFEVEFAPSRFSLVSSGARRVDWKRLPDSIRYGVLRRSHSHWSEQGCIGAPLGALLTRKSGKNCKDFFYRELRYVDGAPVQVLPDCAALSDPYDPAARCLSATEKHLAIEAVVNIE